jgi:YidC/Oxa1 family membrane protein insertase
VVIRICLIPLFVRQIKATRAMQAIQPKMKAIQERYKSDRQRQSEEMMKLYKEAGTNPFSSCLPILVQSPFFISLYQVLNHIARGQTVGVINQDLLTSAQHAHIFGAPLSVKFTDSAAKVAELGANITDVRIVTITMIILMSASQFITQRQLMTKNMDLTVKTPFMQQQKMLMYVFPIMFAVFGINFPVGVLVYWLTTNVWTMGQQLVVIRRNPTPGSHAWNERQDRLKKTGRLNADGTPVKSGFTSLVKGGAKAAEAAPAVESTPQVVRQQPKRQSKSQRQQQTTGTGGKPGVADAADPAEDGAAAKPQGSATPPKSAEPAAARSTSGGGGAKGAAGGGKRSGGQQQGKRTPQPAGQRPKKKS